VVRTEEATVSPALGQTIALTPRADRVHHFDAATGMRISD
jgi:sn-glycerol 3-phosphate transport system ATP-binding protein